VTHANAPSLQELFEDESVIEGDPGIRPCSVVEDSRRVAPGALFVARAGASDDGSRHLDDALARGASAILLASDLTVSDTRSASVVRTPDPRSAGARAAHRFHGDPARALDVLAITGTNGKTTVAWLIRALLSGAGRRCGLLGTIETDDGAGAVPAELTTPSACDLAELMGRMVRNDCDAVVLEASSHALDQGRLLGFQPDRAIYTNLSGDHLDYHGSLESYADAKARLFEMLPPEGVAIVNVDCPMHERVTSRTRARLIRCSTTDTPADARARVIRSTRGGTTLRLDGPWGGFEVETALIGRHNAENLILACALAHSIGVDGPTLERCLPDLVAPPGRLEPVTAPDADCTVLVDYAHTDDALRNVLLAVRPLVPESGRLTVLFGCGGDRDRTKRPRMASVACEGADNVMVTSDNPRTEDPDAIIEDVLRGVPDGDRGRVRHEVDRAAAIERVIREAIPGEVIVIAGKGHEDYQILGTTRRDFDDRVHARRVLEALAATDGRSEVRP
jgi:UDP-N-acetylmuramoyl-L-alanyl-D-glutamate--2,6-diaminopimelate ligase